MQGKLKENVEDLFNVGTKEEVASQYGGFNGAKTCIYFGREP